MPPAAWDSRPCSGGSRAAALCRVDGAAARWGDVQAALRPLPRTIEPLFNQEFEGKSWLEASVQVRRSRHSGCLCACRLFD